jgi:predicted nucleic acid-binding protein
MGSLTLPSSGRVYVDSMTLIYTVEQFAQYWPLLQPLWAAAAAGSIEVISSELIITEVLVAPLRSGNRTIEAAFDQALQSPTLHLHPITQTVLREAARVRAVTRLRTPDALHAATALLAGCVLFVTNDKGFRGVPGLPVVILDDLLTP